MFTTTSLVQPTSDNAAFVKLVFENLTSQNGLPITYSGNSYDLGDVKIKGRLDRLAWNNVYNENGWNVLHFACAHGRVEVVEAFLANEKLREREFWNSATGDTSLYTDGTPLFIASQEGHEKVVKLLLDNSNVDVNKATEDGATPLFIACCNGHEKVAKLLLEHPNIEVDKARHNGCTPLHAACQNGHEKIVKLLLSKPAVEVDEATDGGYTPLIIACENGRESN